MARQATMNFGNDLQAVDDEVKLIKEQNRALNTKLQTLADDNEALLQEYKAKSLELENIKKYLQTQEKEKNSFTDSTVRISSENDF